VIVVAGGSGTLGTRLVLRLAGQGLAVRVLTRDPARAHHLAGPGMEVARGDVRDPASIAGALRGAPHQHQLIHGSRPGETRMFLKVLRRRNPEFRRARPAPGG
jgi:uncharacterized protein YbjT (DUF2867 family)